MARFRIVKRQSAVFVGVPVFDVEEKCWFSWEPRGIFDSFEAAEHRVNELKSVTPIKTMVVKEYD